MPQPVFPLSSDKELFGVCFSFETQSSPRCNACACAHPGGQGVRATVGCLVQGDEGGDSYQHTLQRLEGMMEDRAQQYDVADMRVSLSQTPSGGDLNIGAAAAVVTYRFLHTRLQLAMLNLSDCNTQSLSLKSTTGHDCSYALTRTYSLSNLQVTSHTPPSHF